MTDVQGGGFDGPPTRVPGGGRGHPGMVGPGRGMARGAGMPPPGVAVDKWQQQGPMAPGPGQPTCLHCVTVVAFASALYDVIYLLMYIMHASQKLVPARCT